MKKLLIVLSVLAVLGVGIALLVLRLTGGMADSANAFFDASGRGDMMAAREQLSTDFKAATDAAALERFLADNGLLRVTDTTWNNRKISGGRGELSGSVHTDAGSTVPLTLVMVEENEVWKIHAIQKVAPGFGSVSEDATAAPAVPATAQQVALVKRSMHDFAVSLDEGHMTHFYGTLSSLFREQTSVEALNEAFAPFYENEIGLLGLDGLDPLLADDASIDSDGVLTLNGHYASQPNEVVFTHRYVYEGTDWALLGINVSFR